MGNLFSATPGIPAFNYQLPNESNERQMFAVVVTRERTARSQKTFSISRSWERAAGGLEARDGKVGYFRRGLSANYGSQYREFFGIASGFASTLANLKRSIIIIIIII